MPTRTTDQMIERGVVSVYDLQIFLEVSGWSVDPTVNGDFDGKLGPHTQRALASWIRDYTEASEAREVSTIPSADGTFVTFSPASLAKPIVFTARDVDVDAYLGNEPGGSSAPVPVADSSPVPAKPFFRAGNPWLWAGALAIVGGGVYAYNRGLIPGLGGLDGDDYDCPTGRCGMGATAIRRGGPSTGELMVTAGYTIGIGTALIGAVAWGYGKWGGKVDESATAAHLQSVQRNGTIMVFVGLATAGATYIYAREQF